MLLRTLVTHHADSVLASVASVGTTASLAELSPPDVTVPVSLLPYLISLLGPVLVLVANRVLSAKAAGKRARKALLDREAASKENDGDPANDAEVRELKAQAAELEAEAAVLDALKPGPK